MTEHLTSWATDVWPYIDYAIHPTEAAAHQAALAKSGEINGEVAVMPLADIDTTTKRGTK